jgi:hypothetical protein
VMQRDRGEIAGIGWGLGAVWAVADEAPHMEDRCPTPPRSSV